MPTCPRPEPAKAVSWFLYVLQCSDDSLYCGITTDTKRRLKEHNTGPRGARYTRARRPVSLVHTESYDSQSAALKAEYAFKRLSRRQKLARLSKDKG